MLCQFTGLEEALLCQLPGQRVNGAGKKLVKRAVKQSVGNTPHLLFHPGTDVFKQSIHIHSRAEVRDFQAQAVFSGSFSSVFVNGRKKQLLFFHVISPSEANIMPYFTCSR